MLSLKSILFTSQITAFTTFISKVIKYVLECVVVCMIEIILLYDFYYIGSRDVLLSNIKYWAECQQKLDLIILFRF